MKNLKRRIGIIIIVISLSVAIGAMLSDFVSETENQKRLASDFALTDLDGEPFNLGDFRGNVVVLDFMATWCDPCRTQIDYYRPLWEKYGGKMFLISISIDPSSDKGEVLHEFRGRFPFATWIWAVDTEQVGKLYTVSSIPTTILIDKDGFLVQRYIGVTDSETLIRDVEHLLT